MTNLTSIMINVIDRGFADYDAVLAEQQEIFDKLVNKQKTHSEINEECVILVEHPSVYTLGVHANSSNVLVNSKWLEDNKIKCVHIQRGGDVTYHGPGQIVVYPIISLQKHGISLKDYVSLLEQAVIDTLAQYGIVSGRVEGATGVWLGMGTQNERKICAIGVRCNRFITMHGLALNVNTDLSYFNMINPCGFVDKGVTSMEKELGCKIDFEKVKYDLANKIVEKLK